MYVREEFGGCTLGAGVSEQRRCVGWDEWRITLVYFFFLGDVPSCAFGVEGRGEEKHCGGWRWKGARGKRGSFFDGFFFNGFMYGRGIM